MQLLQTRVRKERRSHGSRIVGTMNEAAIRSKFILSYAKHPPLVLTDPHSTPFLFAFHLR